MKASDNLIPQELYKEIIHLMPILCVDLVVRKNEKFLLLKRKNKPAQYEWWLPGGRILKNETFEDAAKRKLTEETGLVSSRLTFLGIDETFFPDGAFNNTTHTVNVVFAADIDVDVDIELDEQSSGAEWFDSIDEAWDGYVKKFLTNAGYK